MYEGVAHALETGADPAMLCTTCPWDRLCITPPSMTRGEIDRHVDEATRKTQPGDDGKGAIGGLITALYLAGRDTSAQLCPVLAMHLRLGAGRAVVDLVKSHMQQANAAEGRKP